MIAFDFKKPLQAASGKMQLDIALQLSPGSFTTIYGKSGAGKTTILRILAGLEKVATGQIIVNDVTWLDTNKKTTLPPQKRNVGIVFQDYGLFPHMTVRENLLFPLQKKQDASIIQELITATELGDLQHQRPQRLSGGQRQRVALARALVQQPELLLLDEPLSALDPEMRQKLRLLIKQLHTRYGLTTIMISHDQEEILQLSDYAIQLDHGKVIQQGTPLSLFNITSSINGSTLQGKVIAIESDGNTSTLTVLIGKNIVRVPFTKKESTIPSVGDEIVLSFNNDNQVHIKP